MISFFYDSYALILVFLYPGIVLGAIYDIFRIFRIARTDPKGSLTNTLIQRFAPSTERKNDNEQKKKHTETFLVFLEDFIFCIICSLVEILFFYHVNGGEIRLYGLFFSVVGFLIYQNTIGRIIIYTAKQIIFLIRHIMYAILCLILIPLIFIGKKLKNLYLKLGKSQYRKKKGHLKNHERQKNDT